MALGHARLHRHAQHLGLTHNDVLQRLLAFAARGRAGDFLPEGFVPAIGVSASETIVRGVPLNVVA